MYTGYCESEYLDGVHWNIDSGLTEVPNDIPVQAKKVYLFADDISEINPGEFKYLSSCKELWMEDNQLSHIAKDMWNGLDSLNLLYLSRNDINDLDPGAFSTLPRIKELWLDENEMTVLSSGTFQGLTSLEMLDLSYNYVSDIENGAFSNLTNCFELWLDGNELREIRAGMWEGLNVLELLSIEGNKFITIQDGGFSDHVNTHILENNKLKTFTEEVWRSEDELHLNKNLFQLELALNGNPLQCDSRLCWMKEGEMDGWLHLSFNYYNPPQCVNYPRAK